MDQFDEDGSGEITYTMFCEMVMDSRQSDSTSFGSSSPVLISKAAVQDKIRDASKRLFVYFGQLDKLASGKLSRDEIRSALERHDIVVGKFQFDQASENSSSGSVGKQCRLALQISPCQQLFRYVCHRAAARQNGGSG